MSQLQADQLVEEARKELTTVGMQLPTNPLNCRIVIPPEERVPKEKNKGGRENIKNFSKGMHAAVVEVMQLKTPKNSDDDNEFDRKRRQ